MKNIYGIYGASGFGREVMPLARHMLEKQQPADSFELFFVDDGAHSGAMLNGHAVLTYRQFLECRANTRNICIAIANNLNMIHLCQLSFQNYAYSNDWFLLFSSN